MRYARLVAVLAFPVLAIHSSAYELTGRIEPPAAFPVFLHGATAPFEGSTESDADGRFRFHKISAGTYTLAISTAARGEALKTIEVGPGTVDSKGRLDIVLRIDDSRLESEGVHATGATVSATVLSIPDRAMQEYEEAQRSLSRRDPDRASAHLLRAVEIAPHFVAAWNQLGVMAYQARRYDDAEAKFRRALNADPEAFEPLVNLGGVLLNLDRPQEALGYNQRAVTRRPNNALANSQLGLTYFDLDDPDTAEKYLKAAIRLDPAHFSHPQLTLAEIYLRRGDRPSALLQFRAFLEQHPDSPQAATVHRKIAELSRPAQ
jgi:tetratricopeptide (TPR) repeat protein